MLAKRRERRWQAGKRPMKLKSIQVRFALGAGACLLIAACGLIGYSAIAARQNALRNAQHEAIASAQIEADRVRMELEHGLNIVRTLTQTLVTAKEASEVSLSREAVNAIIKRVLAENPQLVALYSDWEPNAFDGRDAEYGGKAGYNPDGRFNFTWSRGEDGEIRSDVTAPGDEETDEWYQAPKRTMKETIIEPYPYAVQGREVLETTLAMPIIVKGKFIGMVGADIKIDFLQKLADSINLFNGTGKLLLLSNQGVIAGATGQPQLIKKTLQAAFPELQPDLANIKAGKKIHWRGEWQSQGLNSADHWSNEYALGRHDFDSTYECDGGRQTTVAAAITDWFIDGVSDDGVVVVLGRQSRFADQRRRRVRHESRQWAKR